MTTLADTINARLAEIKDQLARKARGEAVHPSIPTGLPTWDKNGGIIRGILTVIGAATGEGKSIVKLQLARAAANAGFRVLMLDFEDPAGKTADREFSNLTGINSRVLGLLELDDIDFVRLERAAEEVSAWADSVEHHVGLLSATDTLDRIRASTADLILVDYAQAFPEDQDATMERTIARFAWEANAHAQSKNVAIVVFSQIIREVEQRGYRMYENSRKQAQFRSGPDADNFDIRGFCPGGLSDVAWAKSLGERAKELLYLWRPGRIARKLGANAKDDRLKIISGKVNFGEEKEMTFAFDGATASLKELR